MKKGEGGMRQEMEREGRTESGKVWEVKEGDKEG